MTNSTGLFDPSQAWTRVEFGMARAEVAGMQAARAVAEQWAACADVLGEARAFPEVFTDLPVTGSEAVEFAVRAAVADLAVRLGVSAGVVREQAHLAELLMVRTPLVWAHFREGEITAGHARVVADLLTGLPQDCWAGFQEQVLARRGLPVGRSVSNGVCKGWVSLRKETHCWLSIRRRVKSDARLKRRVLRG